MVTGCIRRQALAAVSFSVLALTGGWGGVWTAAQAAADAESATAGWDGSGIETVVVSGTKFNAEAAPAKASLSTTEPQTIITKTYIEDTAAATADYVNILAIVPSMSGLSVNGPGLSDGNVKNTLRGMPDGNFGMTFDGVPFGDTNGPSHHSGSYFPSSTIGSISVERGPGNAGNLGSATYGGSINMYSDPMSDTMQIKANASYGSWNTLNLTGNLQSGRIDALGGARLMLNVQTTNSDGYLSLQNTVRDNELIKFDVPLGSSWTMTFFANRSYLHQHANDKNGATPAQVEAYGKDFGLQDTNAKLGSYFAYNYADKLTDLDYVRLHGTVFDGLTVDDQIYTYAYVNKTVTATSSEQTAAEILAGVTDGLGTKVNGVKYASDIPGYIKLNAYRVWGNILRVSKDYDYGIVTGQVRVGLWSEGSATQRERYYYDVTKCFAAGCDPFGSAWDYADTNVKKGTTYDGRSGVGYYEHSGWMQYEPFIEVDIKPLDNLTLTPGFKYINWEHSINAPVIAASKPPVAYSGPAQFTTSRALPFFTANYRIEESWSTYFQYAQGIYVPDISVFEQAGTVSSFPAAETTSNYQFGSVYYADHFSVDADVYYIGVNNNYSYVDCGTVGGSAGNSCAVNTGKAIYKGLEGQATYSFAGITNAPGWLDGLMLFINGSVNSAKSNNLQLANAPLWTAAGGLIYKWNGIKLSLVDKTVGQQYLDNNHTDKNGVAATSSAYSGTAFYKLGAYSTLNLTAAYNFANFEASVGVNNLLDDRSLVAMSINDSKPSGASVHDMIGRASSLDQYFFQPSRSVQFSLKAKF